MRQAEDIGLEVVLSPRVLEVDMALIRVRGLRIQWKSTIIKTNKNPVKTKQTIKSICIRQFMSKTYLNYFEGVLKFALSESDEMLISSDWML